ncbi:MAG: hypothetical protein P8X51_04505, partial [Maritimibacter sp.]
GSFNHIGAATRAFCRVVLSFGYLSLHVSDMVSSSLAIGFQRTVFEAVNARANLVLADADIAP